MYAFFNTRLTQLLGHERVQAGFEKRSTPDREAGAMLDALLDEAVA
jgi:hypothetical protein